MTSLANINKGKTNINYTKGDKNSFYKFTGST